MGKFIHRVGGQDIPRFGGVRQECDPGAIPPNMFRNAVNVRYQGGRLVSRGGQSKFNTGALSGRVQGIFSSEFEFSTDVPVGAWCSDIGVGGATEIGSEKLYLLGGDSKYIGFYYFSEDQQPVLRRQPYDIIRTADVALASFGDGFMWIGGFDETKNYLKSFSRGGAPTTLASVDRVSGTATFCDIERLGGTIFFSVGSGTYSACRVYRYSGGAIVEDDTPFALNSERGTPHLRALGSELYMVRGGKATATTTKIRRRYAGAWSTLTPSIANFTSLGQPVVYEDAIYAFGQEGETGSPAVIKIVGTTVTTVHTLPAGTSDLFCLPTVFNGYLYYLYEDWNPGTLTLDGLYVGRFDGTTWDDTHKNLFAQFPLVQGIAFNSFLGVFDGKLRAVLSDALYGDCPFTVFSSPGFNTAAPWTKHDAHHKKIEDTLGLIASAGTGMYQSGAVM